MTYTRDELSALRFTARAPIRSVRKTLFYHRLWLPANQRLAAQAEFSRRAGTARISVAQPDLHNTDTGVNTSSTYNNNSNNYSSLAVGYLNAQSVSNKSAIISDAIFNNKLDVFAVVETFHESSEDVDLKRMTPDGYVCVDQPRVASLSNQSEPGSGKSKVRGGGVVLVFKNCFRYKRLDLNFHPKSFEYIAVMLTLDGKKFLAAGVYRPGSKSSTKEKKEFLEEFSNFLELLVVFNSHIVITGDVNIHLDDTNDINTKKFNVIMDCFGLSQIIKQATHVAGHTLDVVMTRSDMASSVSTTVQFPGIISDHSLITVNLPMEKAASDIVHCEHKSLE